MPGYSAAYRLHVVDPVRFNQRIRVTIEHGHANHLSDDWASTAYWYQLAPSPPPSILPVERRLPHRREAEPTPSTSHVPDGAEDEARQRRLSYEARQARFMQRYGERIDARTSLTEQFEEGNRSAARDLRRRFP
jgi:hypothetical protein